MKWSVTLTDRLGPEMLTVLEIKGQVLHRVRLHVKVPGLLLEMLDKILKLDFSVFVPLAIITEEYNASGRITFLVRCPGPSRTTKA